MNFRVANAVSLASSVSVEPFHGVPAGSPVAHSNAHTLLDWSLDGSEIVGGACSVGSVEYNGVRSLSQSDLDGIKFSSIGGFEVELDVECLLGVDFEAISWSICLWVPLVELNHAAATSVAVAVVTLGAWCVTFVHGCVPGVLVGLHDVHLWAPVSSNLVGVTVVVACLTL